jgi:mono/diheme cytochrome c family protein/plastocyanin
MTDEPGRQPEERLPARRPAEGEVEVGADRFTSPPSARSFGLTPERAARIVRQSADARLIGFLVTAVVGLFVILYYFYELGFPGGLSQSRLVSETNAQQVTSVERGYDLYQANCSRCHGVNGEGGIGPTLNRQDKLYGHLTPQYIMTMLSVGGRYACGDPNSVMPVWSNANGGPLNYKQIEDVIAFIRATNDKTYVVRDPSLFTPVIDPATGKEKTFTGWVDPNYKPAPGATPYPACWKDEFTKPSASPGASGSPSGSPAASGAPGASSAPSGTVLEITAQGIAFDKSSLEAPANQAFQIKFTNNDAGVPHNVAIHKDSPGGQELFKGEIFPGTDVRTYDVPALPAGTYAFVCSVHPSMTGTLTVK